jgi:hypothetical protein
MAAWDIGTAYLPNDVVTYNGAAYKNILASTGDDPSASPTHWQQVMPPSAAMTIAGQTYVTSGTSVVASFDSLASAQAFMKGGL